MNTLIVSFLIIFFVFTKKKEKEMDGWIPTNNGVDSDFLVYTRTRLCFTNNARKLS